ncbi:MAG: hypothetical protein ISS25_00640 [Nanoarchaeota archaeon]|nr:hypothetical protein [DPANN group archaeon]MBL7116324.1 hypothetical protein [Nanoarchaeota archaeon]
MAKFLRPGDERDIFVAKWELEFIDTFHMKELYRTAHDFLSENGWSDPEGGETWEYFYYERIIYPKGEKEHRAWWRVQLLPNNSKYVRYFIKLDYRTLHMTPAEVIVNGKKYKTWRGSVVMYCDAWLQLDYQNRWSNHWLMRHFDKFFRKRIYKPYWEAHKLELYKKCYDFNKEMKRFLRLKTPVKEPRPFRHVTGIPPPEEAL